MTRPERSRWTALGVVWTLALALAGWDVYRATHVVGWLAQTASAQSEARFVRLQGASMEEAAEAVQARSTRVASMELGNLAAEATIGQLAAGAGLSEVSIAWGPSEGGSSQRLTVRFKGSYERAATFVGRLKLQAAHVRVTSLKLVADARQAGVLGQLELRWSATVVQPPLPTPADGIADGRQASGVGGLP